MKKKLLFAITCGDVGGAQQHVYDLVDGLRDDYTIRVAAGEGGRLTHAIEGMGIPVYHLRHLRHQISLAEDGRAIRELAGILREYRPDLVHVHSSKAGVLGRVAARICGIPAIFTAHGWAFTEGVSLKRRILGIVTEAACARLGAHIVTVSEYDRKLCLKYRLLAPEKVVTIRNGVADIRWRARPGEEGEPAICMVARFNAQKDHVLLLRAFAPISAVARLRLIGTGLRLEEVKQAARELGISQRVEFLGDQWDVAELLSRCHILALASHWEGLPLCVLEGMRAGLPVVASDVGGTGEAVVDGVTGFLAPRGNAEALSGRLRTLVGNASLRAELGSAGRRRYLAEFTRSLMLAKTRSVYAGALRLQQPKAESAMGCPEIRRMLLP